MNHRLLQALGFAGLSLILLTGCERAAGPARPATRPAGPPRTVQVAPARMVTMERTIAANGTLAAQEFSTLSAKVAGRLQRLAVDVGAEVRQGDLIAQIEPRDYELRLQQAAAALAQARVALGLPLEGDDDRIALEQVSSVKQAQAVRDEAEKNRRRVENLSQSGIASASELDTVQSAFTVAVARYDTALEEARTRMAALAQRRAEYEIAGKQLADASVRAPFQGVVQARPAGVGEYVASGVPIVTLVQTTPLRLRLEVPEREAMLVRTGQLVRLRVEGSTNVYQGHLARLSPALDEQDRILRVEADVPNPGPLRAGQFARAEIVVAAAEEVLGIPANALLTFAGIEKVVGIQEGRALERDVTTGRQQRGQVEILAGLKPGDTVILDPAGLRTGNPVAVAPAGAPGGSAIAAPAGTGSSGTSTR